MRGRPPRALLLEVVCARLLLLGQRHRVGAAATRRTHRDQAGHLAVAGEGGDEHRGVGTGPAVRPQDTGHRPQPWSHLARQSRWPHRSRWLPEPFRPRIEAWRPPRRPNRTLRPARTRTAAASGEPGAAAVRSMWSIAVGEGARAQPHHRGHAGRRSCARWEGNTLVLPIRVRSAGCWLSEQRNADVIRDAPGRRARVDWRVRCDPGVGASTVEADPTPYMNPRPMWVDCSSAPKRTSMTAEVDDAGTRAAPRSRKRRWSCCRVSWAPGASTGDVRRQTLFLSHRHGTIDRMSRWTASGRPGGGRRPRGGGRRRGLGPCRGRRCGAAIGGDRRTGRAGGGTEDDPGDERRLWSWWIAGTPRPRRGRALNLERAAGLPPAMYLARSLQRLPKVTPEV